MPLLRSTSPATHRKKQKIDHPIAPGTLFSHDTEAFQASRSPTNHNLEQYAGTKRGEASKHASKSLEMSQASLPLSQPSAAAGPAGSQAKEHDEQSAEVVEISSSPPSSGLEQCAGRKHPHAPKQDSQYIQPPRTPISGPRPSQDAGQARQYNRRPGRSIVRRSQASPSSRRNASSQEAGRKRKVPQNRIPSSQPIQIPSSPRLQLPSSPPVRMPHSPALPAASPALQTHSSLAAPLSDNEEAASDPSIHDQLPVSESSWSGFPDSEVPAPHSDHLYTAATSSPAQPRAQYGGPLSVWNGETESQEA